MNLQEHRIRNSVIIFIICLADHFFNNCVVTNLLHVVTASGVDEYQIMRVLIGELTSFAAVLIYTKVKARPALKAA